MFQSTDRLGPLPIGSATGGHLKIALSALLAGAGYYALAIVGTVLSVPPSGFAVIWPATAFLISVLLLTPLRLWWIFLAAIVPTHFHMVYEFQQADVPVIVVLCQLVGNFSLAVITALVTRATSETPLRFNDFQCLLKFILLAGLVVPSVVNALVLRAHLWTGWATDFWVSWWQWMLASVFPTITIPPLMVLAFHGLLVGHRVDRGRAYGELGIIAMALFGLSLLVFGWDHPPLRYVPILLLTPIPFLLWAAARVGVAGTSLSLLIFASVISVSALTGRGPLAMSSPIENVISVQVFLITIAMPLMLLAALVEERAQDKALLNLSEHRLATLQEEEHQRLAEELHASTVQHLTAINLNLAPLRATTTPDNAQIIDDMEACLQEATKELRAFTYLLHPARLHTDGLVATLQSYVDGFVARTHLRATFRVKGAVGEMPLSHQQAALRIVQEALANVHRHASASRVIVSLSRIGKRVHLVVSDDGQGMRRRGQSDDGEPANFGVGIPGMKARARELGGTLHVRGQSRGTTIHVVLPM
jgi:signal transduction histidine kinase